MERLILRKFKHMIKNRFHRIINISSISGLMGNPGQVNYSSSKAALNGFKITSKGCSGILLLIVLLLALSIQI